MLQTIILLILLFIFLIKFKAIITIKENIKIKIYIFNKLQIYSNEQSKKRAEEKSVQMAESEIHNYFEHVKFSDIKLFSKNLKKLLDDVKIKKLNIDININTNDYILNAYISTIVTTLISMVIAEKINQIDLKNLNYNITCNDKKTKFEFECIITARFTNIIVKLVKVLYYMFKLKKKGNDKNGKRASNRKFNGNCDVFTRDNG